MRVASGNRRVTAAGERGRRESAFVTYEGAPANISNDFEALNGAGEKLIDRFTA